MYFNIVAGILRERRTLSQNLQPIQVCHMQTSEQSSFMEKETPWHCIKSESSAEAGYTKSTQTCNHLSVSVDMPEIVIENIKYSIRINYVLQWTPWLYNSPRCVWNWIINRTWCWETVYAICWWNEHVQSKAKTQVMSLGWWNWDLYSLAMT